MTAVVRAYQISGGQEERTLWEPAGHPASPWETREAFWRRCCPDGATRVDDDKNSG